MKSHKVEHYLLSGEEVLEGPNEWPGRYIPIFPVIGSETALETKTIRSGLIRFAATRSSSTISGARPPRRPLRSRRARLSSPRRP